MKRRDEVIKFHPGAEEDPCKRYSAQGYVKICALADDLSRRSSVFRWKGLKVNIVFELLDILVRQTERPFADSELTLYITLLRVAYKRRKFA